MAIFDAAKKQLQKLFGRGSQEAPDGTSAKAPEASGSPVCGFAHTIPGHGHAKNESSPCKGASLWLQKSEYTLIAVSDGGNRPRGDRGSRFACQAVVTAADVFVDSFDPTAEDERRQGEAVVQFCRSILQQWQIAVRADYEADPLPQAAGDEAPDPARAYGATLMTVLLTPRYVLGIRGGNGQCVAIDKAGNFDTPIPWNDKCRGGTVPMLCDRNAIQDLRAWFSREVPAAVFLGSDGVGNGRTRRSDLFALYGGICKNALGSRLETAGDRAAERLAECAQKGRQDSISMAGILDGRALQAIGPKLEAYLAEQQRLRALEASKRRLSHLNRELKEIRKRLEMTEQQLQDSTGELAQIRSGHSAWSGIPGLEPNDAEMAGLQEGIRNAREEIDGLQVRLCRLCEEADAEKETRAKLEAAAPANS